MSTGPFILAQPSTELVCVCVLPRRVLLAFRVPFCRGSPSAAMAFPSDLPTPSALADAQRSLVDQRSSLCSIDDKIEAAERALAALVQESKSAIEQMKQERADVQRRITETLAYVSPIRRLPQELLRYTFLLHWEDQPCSGWVFAAVSTGWRRLALATPQLWRKVSSQCVYIVDLCIWVREGMTIVRWDRYMPTFLGFFHFVKEN